MTIKELHNELIQAYSVSNLNTISLTLINLFKSRQFSALQKISDIIREFVDINISNEGRGFSKLMMLYHPDRALYHTLEINKLAAENNYEGLRKYSHILKLEKIGEIATAIDSYEDIDYSPVYEWDIDPDSYRIFNVNDASEYSDPFEKSRKGPNEQLVECSFYEAVMMRELIDADVENPLFYLRNIEDLELSSSGINDLYGVQFCIHARSIDLSDNSISDLLPLINLKELEELNLSDNEIGIIDELSYLRGLRSIILSNNCIDDISPLFELKRLEYVDLSGNNVDIDQIDTLTGLGVAVDY
jgi:Leucine-rich repeat (LRR) protein